MTSKDYTRLLQTIDDHLMAIVGTEKTPGTAYDFLLSTPLGAVDVKVERGTDRRVLMLCRFHNPRLAIERLGYDQVNLTSGKWNTWFSSRDKAEWVFRMFVKRIDRLFDFQAIHVSAHYAQQKVW